jgi:hypothetical protein
VEFKIDEPQEMSFRIEPPDVDPMMSPEAKTEKFNWDATKEAGTRTLADIADYVVRNITLGLGPHVPGSTPTEEKSGLRRTTELGTDVVGQVLASMLNPVSLPARIALIGPKLLGRIGSVGEALTGKIIGEELAPLTSALMRGVTEGGVLGGVQGAQEGGLPGVFPGALTGAGFGAVAGVAGGAMQAPKPLPTQIRIGQSMQDFPGAYNMPASTATPMEPFQIPGSYTPDATNLPIPGPGYNPATKLPGGGFAAPESLHIPQVEMPPTVTRPQETLQGMLQEGPQPSLALPAGPPEPRALPVMQPQRALPLPEPQPLNLEGASGQGPFEPLPIPQVALPITKEPMAIAAPQQIEPTVALLDEALSRMKRAKRLESEVNEGRATLGMGERESALLEAMAAKEKQDAKRTVSAVADQLLVHNRGSVAAQRGEYNVAKDMQDTLDEVARLRNVAAAARPLSPHIADKVSAEADGLLRRVSDHLVNSAKPGALRLAGIVAGSLEGFDTYAEAGDDGKPEATHVFDPGKALLGAAIVGGGLLAAAGAGSWMRNRSKNAAQWIANYQAGKQIPSKMIQDGSKLVDRWFTIPHILGEKFQVYRPIVKEAMAFIDKRNRIASQQMERLQPYFAARSPRLDNTIFEGTTTKTEFTPAQLRARGFTPAEIDGYNAYRTTMQQTLKRLETGLVLSGIDPAIAANAVAQINHPGYAPLSRFGKFYVAVEDNAGNLSGYYTQETKAQHNAAKGLIQSNLGPGEKISNAGQLAQTAPELLRGFDVTTFAGLHHVDQWLQQQLGPQHWMASQYGVAKMLAQSGVSASRFVQHLRTQKGVPGYSADLGRNTADYLRAISHYIAVRESKYDTTKLLDILVNKPNWQKLPVNFQKHFSPTELADVQANWQPRNELFSIGTKYLDDVYNPSGDFGKLRESLFHFYLGGKMSSALVNLTGYATIALPEMQRYTPNAVKVWAGSMRDAFREDSLSPAIKAGLKLARMEGVVGSPNIQEMMGLVSGRQPMFKHLSDISGYLFGAAEDKLRTASYIAGRRIAADRGLTGQKAHELAVQLTRDANLEYSKADRPRFIRSSWGAPLGTFRLFQYNMMSKFKEDLKTIANEVTTNKAITPEALNALKVFSTRTATLGAVAGAMGIPGAKLVVDLARKYAGIDIPGELRAKTGKVGDLALRGLPYGAGVLYGKPEEGVDLSGSAGYGDVVPSEMFTDPVAGVTKVIGGVLPDALVVRPFKAGAALAQGDPWRALEQVLPEALKGASVATRTAMDRQRAFRTPAHEPIVTNATPTEIGARGIGFTPARLSRAYDREAGEQMLRDYNIQIRGKFEGQIAEALINKDVNALADIIAELKKYNLNSKPEYRVDFGTALREGIKRRMIRMTQPEATEIKSMPRQARGKYQDIQSTYKGL